MDMTDEEFDEDFGAEVPNDEELNGMLAEARSNGDVRLRRLIKHHQALRHVARFLLEQVEEQGSVPANNESLKLSRFIIRGG